MFSGTDRKKQHWAVLSAFEGGKGRDTPEAGADR